MKYVSLAPILLILKAPMDLAYRCVMPAPLGYAIHRIEVLHVSVPTTEEVAIIMDAQQFAKAVEVTIALWRPKISYYGYYHTCVRIAKAAG